jgi:hypothetical protein
MADIIYVLTNEEKEALEKVKARRPRIRLEAIGIKPRDVLRFSRDESLTATVAQSGMHVPSAACSPSNWKCPRVT